MSAHRTHRQHVEELYADDPYVTPEWYGRFLEEADELDAADARNAELLEVWGARADEEAAELA